MSTISVLAAGCITTPNSPLNTPSVAGNTPLNNPAGLAETNTSKQLAQDGVLVAVAFSGGGTRAAAFGYGVIKEVEATQIRVQGKTASLIEYVDFLSGVSGGSVLAAYAGLRGREGLADFRERFLIRNAEENLTTDVGLATMSRAIGGGINDSSRLPRWLDDNLFKGATMGDLERNGRAHVHIYATDLYNRHPFVFSKEEFHAICSDFDSYPISHAVAASAAVPIIFSPIVLESFPERCSGKLPDWVDHAVEHRDDNEMLRSAARGQKRNRDPEQVRYVKLVDGGLTDNFGVTNFIVQRSKQHTPYAPLTQDQAVKIRRALFLVANAGQAPSAPWARTLEGPAGIDMVNAISDAAIRANVRANFEQFREAFSHWRDELVRWRCAMPAAQVRKLRGTLLGWNCRDVQFFVAEIGFDQLEPERLKELSAVPTRFKLLEEQVDLAIAAGRDATRNNAVFRRFVASVSGDRIMLSPATPHGPHRGSTNPLEQHHGDHED